MADEKVRRAFDGSPLPAFDELDWDAAPDPYPSITEFSTRDGRRAVEREDGKWYEADAAGDPILDRPIDKDQVLF